MHGFHTIPVLVCTSNHTEKALGTRSNLPNLPISLANTKDLLSQSRTFTRKGYFHHDSPNLWKSKKHSLRKKQEYHYGIPEPVRWLPSTSTSHRPPRPMSSAQRRTGCGAKFGGAPTLPGSRAWALHRVGLSLLKVSEILKSLLGGFGAMLETSHSHSGAWKSPMVQWLTIIAPCGI